MCYICIDVVQVAVSMPVMLADLAEYNACILLYGLAPGLRLHAVMP